MQPQTDAEMHAWNYGVDWHEAACAPGSHLEWGQRGERILLDGDAERALDILGPDLFWTWVERGYAAAVATTH
jgi:hypothetical protein